LWPLLGDPTQIHQVLLNLAVNARDAMPDGGQLTFAGQNIVLEQRRQFLDFEIPPGRYVCLSVSDTGTGIATELVERIFEPFFTTKPAGKGTGLGLSTVLGIVKSHGGLVEVQTQPGAGSTFMVYLPAAPPQVLAEVGGRHAMARQGRGETILVVDDEVSILQTTRSMLQANGYQVLVAKQGMEALALLSENRQTIRAVVTDIMMPVMDGLALTRTIRERDPELPVVAATGLLNQPNEEDRAAQMRALDVRHFLRKPFAADALLTALDEVIN
jgi:two-component system, cell cycle sensor histidine kinase and response regulator CckA